MMKVITALFAAANYAALAPLPAAADCGVSNFKINDERVLRKKKNDGEEVNEALFEETTEAAKAAFDSTEDTTSPAPTPPMTKSGKAADHGKECALDVLQRAVMFANYMFELLDEDSNNEVTSDELCKLVSDEDAEDEFFKYELRAAIAIGGDQAVQALIAVATDACPGVDFDPMSKTEFEIASVLWYCDQTCFF